jgi:hypothetical protein
MKDEYGDATDDTSATDEIVTVMTECADTACGPRQCDCGSLLNCVGSSCPSEASARCGVYNTCFYPFMTIEHNRLNGYRTTG